MASSALRDELLCSICLNIYTDPVTLRCGHNFCRVCMDQHLKTQDGSRVYSCPECRAEFQERPVLQRNIALHNVAQHLRSPQPHQKITGICCTYCIHPPVPAVKSCLLCEASLCDDHLNVHSKSPEHILTDPSTSLVNKKCSVHKELFKYYCTKDAMCICVSCSLAGEHRGHQVEMLDEASKKKKKLRNVLQKLNTRRKETKKRVQSLEEITGICCTYCIHSPVPAVKSCLLCEASLCDDHLNVHSKSPEHVLTDPSTSLENKKCSVHKKILEYYCTEDAACICLYCSAGKHQGHQVEKLDEASKKKKEKPRNVLQTLITKREETEERVQSLEDPTYILLDINTASNDLLISDDLKTATWTDTWQNHPETAERFQYIQVMSRRRFTSGRHYWDVEISRSWEWRVGMCYPSIDRRGDQSFIGYNNKSWCLRWWRWNNDQYSVRHDSKVIQLPHQISSDRFRICLDYEAGQLSFYELCDPIRHLHTFTTTFTEPLHAALWVCVGSIKILGGGRNWKKPS